MISESEHQLLRLERKRTTDTHVPLNCEWTARCNNLVQFWRAHWETAVLEEAACLTRARLGSGEANIGQQR